MNKNIQTLRGFRDFLPEQMIKRQWLLGKIMKVFESWGYDPLETPTLEPLELFVGQIGEDEKLFFKFKDQGDREVALRYDQTVPICRVIGQNFNNLVFPFRRYQIQPAFRAEKPQKGRYREFLQCDADIFGITGPLADAEMIALSLDIYRQIGFANVQVLINDRSLMAGIPYIAIVAVDKLKKIGEEGVIKEMVGKGIEQNKANEYLNLVKNLKPNETINIILNYLSKLGFDESWFKFDPTIARSFAYSQGPIWEVVIPGFSGGSVLGGERYDGLVEKISGQKIAGTGFGLGFDRTLEAAIEFNLVPNLKTKTKVLVVVLGENNLDYALKTVNQLREKGINTQIYPDLEVNLGKQFKYADRAKIPYVVVIGDEEVRENKVTLKNMESGEQEKIEIEEIVKLFHC